jgi:tocopherol O-methyltransferase
MRQNQSEFTANQMIVAETRATVEAVARHYDELDMFYREIWGEHVHHGLWLTGNEDSSRAVMQLVEAVAGRAQIWPGAAVCDVGCGYGATARWLARKFGAQVTAVTVTPRQFDYAIALEPESANPIYILCDWLKNELAAGAFDVLIAIESIEHMRDKQRVFREAARVLKRGSRMVVCAWLASENPARWQEAQLLRPICEEGRLPEMATETELRVLMEAAGFGVERFEDLSACVQRTWLICIGRTLKEMCRRPEWRRFLLDGKSDNRVFALTMFRIWVAYVTGAMRYGMFTARLP